jgi:hypothetical protein
MGDIKVATSSSATSPTSSEDEEAAAIRRAEAIGRPSPGGSPEPSPNPSSQFNRGASSRNNKQPLSRQEEALERARNRRKQRMTRYWRTFLCWCCPLYMCLKGDGGCDECCPCCDDRPLDDRSDNPWAPRPPQKRNGAL